MNWGSATLIGGLAYLEWEGAQVVLPVITGGRQAGPLKYPLGRGTDLEIGVPSSGPLLEPVN
ncbi:hypothetical protein [Deinococcus hopiensis]|uniref:hypothetical protein n=1 Tax=Deinococcus hopiensis TaxID=309885 RepID=UPI00111C7FF8|nr:hypothetical protein [Deinococcus hopiensis]